MSRFEAYVKKAEGLYKNNEHNLRKGQCFMNALDSDLYNEISNTELDVFYTEEKIYEFIDYVAKRMRK